MVLFSSFLWGQAKTTAVITGLVTDPTEAVIPGAKVTLSSKDTGFVAEVVTDQVGRYQFPIVPPGAYTIRAQAEGFAAQTRTGVSVTVGQMAVFDFKLEVGQATQVVEVQSLPPLVETERTQQANTLSLQSVTNLPINRRDYLSFSLLTPGVSDSSALADSNGFRVKQTPDSGLSFYGSNGRGNNISVDGGEANDAGGGVRPTVSQEAVQEFQVNRSNYSAESSAARGGVINIVTRGGTNLVHGSIFSFFRQDGLDATNPFAIALQPDNSLRRIKPDSDRQQFGGTVGGPIVKDRAFYFLSYEQLRRREDTAVPVLTDFSIFQPTADQQKILSGLPSDTAAKLRAALTSSPSTVDLFKQNSGVFPFLTDQYQGLMRIDYRISDADQFGFRYNVTNSTDTNPNVTALIGVSRGFVQEYLDSDALAQWTHTFSARMVNEARVQFDYYDSLTKNTESYGPALEIAGYGFFNRDRFLPADNISRREELADNITFTKGRHTLKAGAYSVIRMNRSASYTFFSGRFTFGALPGAFVDPALASTSITALQAFNLGLAQSYQQGFGDPTVKATYPLIAGFVQDTWRPTPRLTFDFGVRYEVDVRKPPMPTDKNNVAPRFGFAWDPFGDKKTTVRGGYGIYYAAIDYQIDYVSNALNEINGYRQIAQVLTTLNAANPFAINGPINIFKTLTAQGTIGIPTPQRSIQASDLNQFGIFPSQTGPRPPLTVLFQPSPDYQNPYAQQVSFGIERQITTDFSVAGSYIYVRGVHLTTSRDTNLLSPPVDPSRGVQNWGATADNPTGTKYFVDPLLFQLNQYESTANSWYNALILEANKRLTRGIGFSANYTFSKSIDETTDYNSDFQPNNQLCRSCERSLSPFDQRHKVVVYATLQSSQKNALLRDFTFTPIFRYNSPRPFNVLAGGELNNDRHNTTDRPYFAGRDIGIGP
ncbi:MAG: TonB-dependent receptor [Acidobacteriia bacterium]|nr:TonB-dependent receptor [Terriglobia bacterium]